MRNTSVKLFLIWTSGSGDVVYIQFLSTAPMAILFDRAKPFVILVEGILRNIP